MHKRTLDTRVYGPIEYTMYNNILTFANRLGYTSLVGKKITSMSEMTKTIQSQPYIKIHAEKNEGKKKKSIYIFLVLDKTYTSKSNEFTKLIKAVKDPGSIVVIVDPEASTKKTKLSDKNKNIKLLITQKNLTIKYMRRSTFKLDILNHALQPHMELCTAEEINGILDK